MSSYLYRLGRMAARHHRLVLLAWLALLVAVGLATVTAGGQLSKAVTIPATEAQHGLDVLDGRFPELAGDSGQLLFRTTDGSDIESANSAIEDVIEAARDIPDVARVTDPFSQDFREMSLSPSGHAALAQIQLDPDSGPLTVPTRDALEALAVSATDDSGLVVTVGGSMMGTRGVEVGIAEAFGVIMAGAVLAITFGSLLAAGIPLLTAVLGVGISMGVILLLANVMEINATTPVLALMIGLAVGIDYALFVVSRHRDQLRTGMSTDESIARSVATAGSAVIFAGATVIIGLLGLGVAQIPFLTVMGAAGAMGVAFAVAVALTALPAILALAGERLRPKASRAPRRRHARARVTLSARWVEIVTRWPKLVSLGVVLLLAAMALPAASLRLGLPDTGSHDLDTQERITYDAVAAEFGPGYNAPLLVIADIINTTDPVAVMDDLAADLAAIPGVASVGISTPNQGADLGVVQITPEGGQTEQVTADLVNRIRAEAADLEARYGISDLMVTGFTAVTIDVTAKLGAALLPFGLVVVGLSLILLTLVFRSITVPIKATIGYLLSVAASFGAVVAVFNWGHLAEMFNVARVGPVVAFLPIILMGVLFGLSMDYEVFLVSRIREDYVHGGDAREAVRTGFVAAARVVAAAAVIMTGVFFAFVPTGEQMIKPIALGLAVGVFVDAFLVRMTLVPALMTLLGATAWWLPRWLDHALPDLDIEGVSLAHHLDHEAWVAGHGPVTVRAEQVLVRDESAETIWGPVDLTIRPGTYTVLPCRSPLARSAALGLLAGRVPPDGGQLAVAGLIQPMEAAALRARVFVEPDSQLAATALSAAARAGGRRGPVSLVAIAAEPGQLPWLDEQAHALLARIPQVAIIVAVATGPAEFPAQLGPSGEIVAPVEGVREEVLL
ncbi:MAG: MMPL family transporter [Candidatus Nanopelagicales bacterium]